MTHEKIRHITGFFLSLTAAFMWGVLPVALKEVLEGMGAATIVWYRFLVAGVLLGLWLGLSGSAGALGRTFGNLGGVALVGLFAAAVGLCANYYWFSLSLNYVNGETSETVMQLSTLFLILGGVMLFKEPFLRVQKLGTALIVGGLGLFFHDRLAELFSLGSRQARGVLIVTGSALAWTVYALLQKRLLRDLDTAQTLLLIYLICAGLLLPFAEPRALLQLDGRLTALLVFCCLNTLIAYGSFAEALNRWDASKVSATLALAPLFTIGSLELIVWLEPDYPFSDRLSPLAVFGAVLLVLGSVLTALVPALSRRAGAASVAPRPPSPDSPGA